MALDVPAIQRALRDSRLDGWLLYDFHGSNPIATRLPGVDRGAHLTTRRWYYLIPREGEPRALVHAIERHNLDALPGQKMVYGRREQLESGLTDLLRGVKTRGDGVLARLRHPLCLAGRRRHGGSDPRPRRGHRVVGRSRPGVRGGVDAGPARDAQDGGGGAVSDQGSGIRGRRGRRPRAGAPLDEYGLQQQMVGWFDEEGLVSDSAPVVAVGPHAGNPHYLPTAASASPIVADQLLLLDLWGKLSQPAAVFADITWVGYHRPHRARENGRGVRRRRRAREMPRSTLVQAAARDGRELRGWEVDRAARTVLVDAGFEAQVLHRTGHSLGEDVHGNGAHLDDFETRDERRLLPGTGFTVEPGVYLDEFGVRTEINVFLRGPRGGSDRSASGRHRAAVIMNQPRACAATSRGPLG